MAPHMYGLPKIHKDRIPLRQIVGAIDSLTYHLTQYLSRALKPIIGQTTSFVKDSFDYIEKIQRIPLQETKLLVSYDVTLLFTKVLVGKVIRLLEKEF